MEIQSTKAIKQQGSITFRLQLCLSFWQMKEGCEQSMTQGPCGANSSKKHKDQNLLSWEQPLCSVHTW